MLYAEPMAEPEKPKRAKWGDLIALGIGTGLIAYFTKIRGNPKYAGPSDESWIEVIIGSALILGAIGLVTYLILRGWDALMARLRRR